MITGVVTAHREAVVPVTVQDRDGRNHEFQAVILTFRTSRTSKFRNFVEACDAEG